VQQDIIIYREYKKYIIVLNVEK